MKSSRNRIDAWKGQIRMPMPIALWLKDRAQANFRSLNAEVVEIVRRAKELERAPGGQQ
jgi:hypothetical protein